MTDKQKLYSATVCLLYYLEFIISEFYKKKLDT